MNQRCARRTVLVTDLISLSAQAVPDKTALITPDRKWTYGELEAESNRVARVYQSVGFGPGERVLILLPNGADAVIAFFGTMKAGAIPCLLHNDLKSGKIAQIAQDSTATALITDEAHLPLLELTSTPCVQRVFVSDSAGAAVEGVPNLVPMARLTREMSDAALEVNRIDQDLAFLVYTSGSTGEAKGVMCPHAAVIAAVHSITQYLENTEDDIVVNVLPLAFDHGLYQVLTMFYVGGTVLLERDFSFPYVTVRRMQEAAITGLPGVPTLFAMLLRLRLKPNPLPSLRYLASTGAPLPAAHISALTEMFPQASLYSMYGLTECKRVSYLPPEEIARRPTSIGRGMPNEELWLADEEGRRLGRGGVGELVVRGANVMRGYWNRPEETQEVFRPGPIHGEHVLYTGDIMRMDEEGFLYFVGRKDDLIKSRGEKVYPKEIEEVLYSLPAVVEVAVVSRPDDLLGQAIIAHVAVAPGTQVSTDMLRDLCATRLQAFQCPQEYVVHESLPKTPAGKIDKSLLRKN